MDDNSNLSYNSKRSHKGGENAVSLHNVIPVHILGAEVFCHLNARDSYVARAVCKEWRETLSTCCDWKKHYASLWKMPTERSLCAVHQGDTKRKIGEGAFWRELFDYKYRQMMGFYYRPERCTLYGHSSGVKAVKLCPGYDKLLTGSVDRRMICWDAQYFSYCGVSGSHGGTVRSIALDDDVLVTGSTDHRVRVWRKKRGDHAASPLRMRGDERQRLVRDDWGAMMMRDIDGQICNVFSESKPHSRQSLNSDFPFDIATNDDREVLVSGHSGPVSCLALTDAAIFSGSWDYSVRVWSKRDLHDIHCVQILHFDDWVLDMKRTRNHDRLHVASGFNVHQVDLGKGEARVIGSMKHDAANETAPVTSLVNSEDGHSVYYGSGDGYIYSLDMRCRHQRSVPRFDCSVLAGSGRGGRNTLNRTSVTGISFEYPWIASSMNTGEVILLNMEDMVRGSGSKKGMSRVLRHGSGIGAHCVDIAEARIAAGFEDGTVLTWDFSRAEEAAHKLAMVRQRKRDAREQRRRHTSSSSSRPSSTF